MENWVKRALRRASLKWPPRNRALASSQVGRRKNRLTNRMAMHFRCAKCRKSFPKTAIQLDHVEPVEDINEGFTGFDNYIRRLFVDEKGFQVLCGNCHAKKTKAENSKRVNTKGSKSKT